MFPFLTEFQRHQFLRMNDQFKGTPGEWKIRFMNPADEESDFFVEARNNNKPDIGYGIEILQDDYGDHNGYPRKQRLADAKLIAAAPDMLQALQQSEIAIEAAILATPSGDLRNQLCDANILIKAAIAKALTP